MLLVQLILLKAITISALTLQLIQPISPSESTSSTSFALPNGPQAAVNAFVTYNSSSNIPQQWDGTIALPLNELGISPSSPSIDDPSQLWNNTYISTFNISAGPRPRPGPKPAPDLPPLSREWEIRCGQSLGTGISASSCLAAWALLPSIDRTVSFGPRNAANTYDVGLPKRYLSTDGLCFIEPTLAPDNTMAHVKPRDAGIAAAYVIRGCIGGSPPQGGFARNIRGNNDLLVSVAKFIPNVVCSPEPFEGDATVLAACEAILDKMATSKQITIFAQRSKYDPGLETPLPAWYIAPAEAPKCALVVTGRLPKQFASWHRIWEAAVAITAMCIRQGKGGFWERIGPTDSITVTVGKARTSTMSLE